ncbi:MAG: hypothetical protein N2C14_08700 [Planctomycetales bacterium]
MRSSAVLCLLALLSTVADAQTAPDDPTTPAPIYTRQKTFRIPFDVPPPTKPSERPVEIELHVSETRGRQWMFHKAESPRAKGFVYRVPRDGEFWFVVRTRNVAGEMLPPSVGPDGRPVPTIPEMKVVVDTELPRLNLHASPGRGGEVIVQWAASDANLASDRPEIEYRELGQASASTAPWRAVAINPGFEGRAALPAPRGSVAIRARVRDKADNLTARSILVHHDGRVEMLPNDAATSPATPPPRNASAAVSSPKPANSPAMAAANLPAGNGAKADLFEGLKKHESPAPNASPQRPAPEQVIMVNSVRFLLEYEVDAVGASGIKSIALWGTTDEGRTWSQHGVDSDMQSPIEVNVPAEGVYGFRMSVQSGAGVGGKPPHRRQKPEIWVRVDATAPEARLNAVQINEETSEMNISWEAVDEQLGDRPITLLFSGNPGGPWYPIAKELHNTRKYAWRLDPDLPRPLHVRLVVTDAAGNKTTIDSADSALTDRNKPQGRIRTARPFSGRFGRRM